MGRGCGGGPGGNARCGVRAALRAARAHRSVTMSSTAPKVVHWLNLRAKRPSCAPRRAPRQSARRAPTLARHRSRHAGTPNAPARRTRRRRGTAQAPSPGRRRREQTRPQQTRRERSLHCASQRHALRLGPPAAAPEGQPHAPAAAAEAPERAAAGAEARGASDSACVRVGPACAARDTAPGRKSSSRAAPGCRPALTWRRRTDEVGDVERDVAVAREEAAGALLGRLGDGLGRRRRRRSARATAGAGRHGSGAATGRHCVGMGRGCGDRADFGGADARRKTLLNASIQRVLCADEHSLVDGLLHARLLRIDPRRRRRRRLLARHRRRRRLRDWTRRRRRRALRWPRRWR